MALRWTPWLVRLSVLVHGLGLARADTENCTVPSLEMCPPLNVRITYWSNSLRQVGCGVACRAVFQQVRVTPCETGFVATWCVRCILNGPRCARVYTARQGDALGAPRPRARSAWLPKRHVAGV